LTKKTCKVEGCNARAWQADLCNLHALERLRGSQRRPSAQRVAEGKRVLRERAQELGIVLADDAAEPAETAPAQVPAAAAALRPVTSKIKVRSPVA